MKLDSRNAEHTCNAMLKLAVNKTEGRVHRAEEIPKEDGGPPNGLIQMTLQPQARELSFHDVPLWSLQRESDTIVRGSVVYVVGTTDILVALSPKPDWAAGDTGLKGSQGFTVFGEVDEESLGILEEILELPTRKVDGPNKIKGTEIMLLKHPLFIRMHTNDVPEKTPGKPGAPWDRSECHDRSSHCGDWAAEGECESNKPYMDKFCSRTCKSCVREKEEDRSVMRGDYDGIPRDEL